MLVSRVRGARWPDDVRGLDQALDQVTAAYYELPAEEVRRRASAVNHIAGAQVPVLVLHPKDDHIIPVRHAEMLREAASGNDLVRVWILEGGGHGALDAVDADWTYAVYRTFFERWARYADREGGEHADLSRERLGGGHPDLWAAVDRPDHVDLAGDG